MNTLIFKCTLLSDVIINQKAATEGSQQTLDFIPGSAFLGIAAGCLYEKRNPEDSFLLFHSGKVRFGDAHPFVDGQRAVHVPCSWYYRKNDYEKSMLFVHHGIPLEGIKDKDGYPVQLKQCREGYILKKNDTTVFEVKINKDFAIKSAYDREKRRSKDQEMYGYQSLRSDSVWCFDVMLDDEAPFKEKLINSLSGKKRIGRSSTAQYGLVEIEMIKEAKTKFETGRPLKIRLYDDKTGQNFEKEGILLYAESRLIFFDENGQPTFTPAAEQLGLKRGEIDWTKSQIRTFQYAPFNNQRRTRDADRCGIEKGSVICVTGAALDDLNREQVERGLGAYLNEGFGRVLVNPEFLAYTEDERGTAVFHLVEGDRPEMKGTDQKTEILPVDEFDTSVLDYLKKQKEKKDDQLEIYRCVNEFVTKHASRFRSDSFASQWGTIRSIAMQAASKQGLCNTLFKKVKKEEKGKEGYLVHGVAAERWEGNKIKDLEKFIGGLPEEIAAETVVNLAAEMAKKCKKEDKK